MYKSLDKFCFPKENKDTSKEVFEWFLFQLCVWFITEILSAILVAVKRTIKKGFDYVSFIQSFNWSHQELRINERIRSKITSGLTSYLSQFIILIGPRTRSDW